MQAEIYSIIIAIEHLECAYVKSLVSNEEYQKHCQQLLSQYKTLQNGLRDKCPDVRTFAQENGMKCPLAEERISTGVPATALYASGATSTGKEALACFKASECFITLSDALKLNLTANDDIMPLVRDLQASIVAIPNLPALPGLDRIAGWLVTLNGMRAAEHLTEDQSRQLALDVEQAYNAMKVWLQDKS